VLWDVLSVVVTEICLSGVGGMVGAVFLCLFMGLNVFEVFDLSRLPLVGHEAVYFIPLILRGRILSHLILIIKHSPDINEIIEIGEEMNEPSVRIKDYFLLITN
jgi:hypothetical protein